MAEKKKAPKRAAKKKVVKKTKSHGSATTVTKSDSADLKASKQKRKVTKKVVKKTTKVAKKTTASDIKKSAKVVKKTTKVVKKAKGEKATAKIETDVYYQRDYKNMNAWLKEKGIKETKDGKHLVPYFTALAGGHPNGKKKAKKTLRRYLSGIKSVYAQNNKTVDFALVAEYLKTLP